MKQVCDPMDCTGCTACQSVCHHHAITMQLSDEGFLYPQIDNTKCVECGLCIKTCPSVTHMEKQKSSDVYLSWINNDKIRLESSSGGLFSALARGMLKQGGVVYGAAYDKDMNVCHQLVENEIDLHRLCGSKYVQSLMGETYCNVQATLQSGRMVYFVGTPCQVSGLRAFLRKEYANLLTSDFICHGVPSGELFKQQVKSLEQEVTDTITHINFRSKKRFGQGCDFQIITRGGVKRSYCAELVPYFYGFWNNLTLRECCYRCQYASTERISDITLADFWLVKKVFPDVHTSKGCSLVLINSDKGRKWIEQISDDIYLRPATIEQGMIGQAHLTAPVKRPAARDAYTGTHDFQTLCQGLLHPSYRYRLKMHLRNAIKLLILFKYWK